MYKWKRVSAKPDLREKKVFNHHDNGEPLWVKLREVRMQDNVSAGFPVHNNSGKVEIDPLDFCGYFSYQQK